MAHTVCAHKERIITTVPQQYVSHAFMYVHLSAVFFPAVLFVKIPLDKNTVRVRLLWTNDVTLLLAFEVWRQVTCTTIPERYELSQISYLRLLRGSSVFPTVLD